MSIGPRVWRLWAGEGSTLSHMCEMLWDGQAVFYCTQQLVPFGVTWPRGSGAPTCLWCAAWWAL